MGDRARAFGRSLSDFPNRNAAEEMLIKYAGIGEVAPISDKIPIPIPETDEKNLERDEKNSETDEEKSARTIRAGLVRFLALGGDGGTPVHELGVQVRGAIIDGDLDFGRCNISGGLGFWNCELTGTLTLRDADIQSANLSGSHCQLIFADGVRVSGSVFLREKFVAKGCVRLLGAKISGDLTCKGGRFEGRDKDGDVLICDGLQVGGYVNLKDIYARAGEVRLLGANIARNLECEGGKFNTISCDRIKVGGDVFISTRFSALGGVRIGGAEIGGDVACIGGTFGSESRSAEDASHALATLVLARASIEGTLWLTNDKTTPKFYGGVDLTGTKIGRIVDSVREYTKRREPVYSSADETDNPAFLNLDGLTYDRFGESTNVSAASRVAFLHLQKESDLGSDFKPQPWMQMIKVLRESGHTEAARDVAIAYEEQRRKAKVIASRTARTLHWAYGFLVRYGHRPMRLVKITVGMWLAFGIFYHITAVEGVFAPSNPLMFQNPAYAQCSPSYERFDELMPEKIGNWYWCGRIPDEYTTFNPYLYSLDLILPLTDLQQDKDWAPTVPTPRQHDMSKGWLVNHMLDVVSPYGWHLNHFVRWAVWAEILFGWIASLLFVSVAANFVKRMEMD